MENWRTVVRVPAMTQIFLSKTITHSFIIFLLCMPAVDLENTGNPNFQFNWSSSFPDINFSIHIPNVSEEKICLM